VTSVKLKNVPCSSSPENATAHALFQPSGDEAQRIAANVRPAKTRAPSGRRTLCDCRRAAISADDPVDILANFRASIARAALLLPSPFALATENRRACLDRITEAGAPPETLRAVSFVEFFAARGRRSPRAAHQCRGFSFQRFLNKSVLAEPTVAPASPRPHSPLGHVGQSAVFRQPLQRPRNQQFDVAIKALKASSKKCLPSQSHTPFWRVRC
jgi:hypothetical protein